MLSLHCWACKITDAPPETLRVGLTIVKGNFGAWYLGQSLRESLLFSCLCPKHNALLINEADYTTLLLYFIFTWFNSFFHFIGSWIAFADDASKCHAFGRIFIAASLHYLRWWCNMAWLGPSVQVDNAKPQHNDVKGKEGDAKEAWGIAFTCGRCNIDASPDLLTHVVLLSRIDHHRLVTWNCGCLRRSLN